MDSNLIQLIIVSVVAFLALTLILVALLLYAKTKLTPSGVVKININDGTKELEVTPGSSLLTTLANEKIFLPSACGGKGSCGQCKCRVLKGGGTILPTEVGFFNRKQIQNNWRLGCQVKVKEDLEVVVPESALSVKKWECEVISNNNVATFIKEFCVKIPDGETLNYRSGGYIQVDVPAMTVDYKDMDIDPQYRADWEKMGVFNLKMVNPTPTLRAYSMATYPSRRKYH
jgi:Na+-transporting NADH:ubiquinone oxidoreductase, subunit NqrF